MNIKMAYDLALSTERSYSKILTFVISFCLCQAGWYLLNRFRRRRHTIPTYDKIEDMIGHTPLFLIKGLSRDLNCKVLAKCEFLNPTGSIKDRAALYIIEDAEKAGKLKSGDRIFEGTVGSTGISLALLAQAKGYSCHIVMPDDQSPEKTAHLHALGATITHCDPVSFVDPLHYCKKAETFSQSYTGPGHAFFANQFENLSNFRAHYETTGKEILEQTQGQIDVFVCSAGSGGTVSGVSTRLLEHRPTTRIYLGDTEGSGLSSLVQYGVFYSAEYASAYQLRHPFYTITEGIGMNRMTKNLQKGYAHIDACFKITDEEVVEMSQYLLREEGLFVGSSSALNCCAIVKAYLKGYIQPGETVVTLLCDSGARHLSKLYNAQFLDDLNLLPAYLPLPENSDFRKAYRPSLRSKGMYSKTLLRDISKRSASFTKKVFPKSALDFVLP